MLFILCFLTIDISSKIYTLWYTVCDVHQLLPVSARRCLLQGVVITEVYKATCQSRLACCLTYLSYNDPLRMAPPLSKHVVADIFCECFGNMCTCIYCVLYCLYCLFCIVWFMYIYPYRHRVKTQIAVSSSSSNGKGVP